MAPKKHKGKPAGHGECRSLTPEEIAALQPALKGGPLTPEQMAAKAARNAARPDNSHLTVWAP